MRAESALNERNSRTSVPAVCAAVLLCLCMLLALLLPPVPAACERAGSTWEDRLDAARKAAHLWNIGKVVRSDIGE